MLPDSLQPDLQLWNGSSEACGALQTTLGTGASTNAVQQEPSLLGLDPIVRALQGLGLLQMDTKQLEELLMQQQEPTQPPQQQQQWQQQKQQQQAQPFVSDVAASPLDASWQTLAEAMAQQSPVDVNLASLDYAAFAQQQQQQQQEAQKQQQQALWALSSGISPAGLAGMSPPHDLTPLLQRDLHSNMLQSELRSNVPAGPPGLDVGLRQAFSQPMQESHTVLSGDALAQRLFGGVAGSMPAPHMSLNHAPRPYRQHAPNPYGAMRNIGSSARERMLLQAAQQLPVSAAPSAAPRAPVWNKPTWDRMGVVPGAGHKVSTGTGVFFPKTSMPAASSAAGAAGAGARSEPAMAVAQLHEASSGRGYGPVGGMGVGARS